MKLSLEAPVLAAMVTASVTLFSKIVEWAGSRDAKVAAQAQKVVEQAYDPLRQKLTDGCVRVLKYLEDREYRMTSVIRSAVHPTITIPNDLEDTFDGEFRYRMEYLRHCGVVGLVGGSEYGITEVGLAFLEHARRRKDYYKVLFGG